MINKIKYINIWIATIVILGFVVAVIFENNRANNYYEKQTSIGKLSEINIDVISTHWNRGVLSLNEKYYFSVGDFNITQNEIDNLELNCSQIKHVYKAAMSDTLKLTYGNWTDSIVFR